MRILGKATGAAVCLLCLLSGLLAALPLHAGQRVRVDYQPGKPPEGIFVDVIEAIARKRDWSIEYVPGTFAEGMARLAAGQIDLMSDVARTTERERLYSFPREPVLSSWNQVYARPGSGIRSLLDLQGKRVAVLNGSVQQNFFQEMAASFGVKTTLIGFPDYASAFDAVVAGQSDAVVSNPLYGAARGRKRRLEDTAIIFAPAGLFFAAPQHADRSLLDALDNDLVEMKKDPSSAYYGSMRRWTAVEPPTVVPRWLLPAALVAAALMVLALLWILTLRRTAAMLRQSEQRQRLFAAEIGRIFKYSLDAICVLDADLRFLRVSDACEKLWGWRPSELVGQPFASTIAAMDQPAAQALLAAARQGQPTAAVESVSQCRDGARRHIVWSAAWSNDQREFYCIARDDTERRELLARLHARTAELQQANDELQAFSYSVSHDLRAPLSTISGFSGKLLRDHRDRLDPPSLSRLERVLAATQRMGQLIDDLLELARISQHEMNRSQVDLGELAQEVVDSLRQRQPQREVRVEIAPQLQAMADPGLVQTILENLIGNAWKFTSGRPQPLIVYFLCATTARVSTWRRPTACLRRSSACTRPLNSRAPASA
jgi:PAS domain S-box-containing protein